MSQEDRYEDRYKKENDRYEYEKNMMDMDMKKKMVDMKNTKRTYVLATLAILTAVLIISTACDDEKQRIDQNNNDQLETSARIEMEESLRKDNYTYQSCIDYGGVWDEATLRCEFETNTTTASNEMFYGGGDGYGDN
ncbi:hypothetical protein JXB31_02335 [Candidatus Woesearchaeota archaeon]|nr:hypothetical protein [Candidatus Woesearchaeota archaeon]